MGGSALSPLGPRRGPGCDDTEADGEMVPSVPTYRDGADDVAGGRGGPDSEPMASTTTVTNEKARWLHRLVGTVTTSSLAVPRAAPGLLVQADEPVSGSG